MGTESFKEYAANVYGNGVYQCVVDSDLIDNRLEVNLDVWPDVVSVVDGMMEPDRLKEVHANWIDRLVEGKKFPWWKVWFSLKIFLLLLLVSVGTLEVASWTLGYGITGMAIVSGVCVVMLLSDLFIENVF